MLDQKSPLIPRIPKQNKVSKAINYTMKFLGFNDEDVIDMVGIDENAETCINTATGQYDNCNKVSGNITFSNYNKAYGFKEVASPKVGDLIQFTNNAGIPHHTGMVTGFAENGDPLFSYSRGGHSPEDMVKDSKTLIEDLHPDTYKYYTFIGNRKNASKWRREYEQIKAKSKKSK